MKYLLTNQASKRLTYRSLLVSDYDKWLTFHQDPNTSRFWKPAYSSPEKECIQWFKNQFNRYANDLGGMNAMIEKETSQLVGFCGLLVQKVDGIEELEIGYSLLPEFWGKGYASEGAQKCKKFAFENEFVESLISIISLENIPSQKVATRNGMTLEKRTSYHDNPVYIFRILSD